MRPGRRPLPGITLLAAMIVILGVTARPVHGARLALFQQAGNSPTHSMAQQLVKESREAAGEDDNDQFKHSASVQFVARLTGLSLEHAYWACVVLNFAVIALVILWISKKNLPGAFRNRTASIQKAMEEARKASQDANRRLADIEARLSHLDAEISDMRVAAEKDAAAEEQRIKTAAEEDARKIVEASGQEVQAAARLARRELKAYAADLAVSLAQKNLHVDTATDHKLVLTFSQQLSANGEERKS